MGKKNSRKKGFTLVELIVVISVLVIVAGLFAVNMMKTLNKNKDEEQKEVVAQITSAADAYVVANPEEVKRLYNGYGYVDIEVGELRDKGFLSEKLKDAETGEIIADEEIVRVKLEIGDFLNFIYPVSPADKNAKAWSMVAEDMVIEYDPEVTSGAWCSDEANKYSGLYDKNFVDLGNYAEVTSKLYLMDNGAEGKIFDGDYFKEAGLDVTSCNVNPQKAGTYNITYTYLDPSMKNEKTFNRVVYVKTSTNDAISFTAVINDNKKIALNAKNVPIKIVETYKDGSTAELDSTDSSLGAINYAIEGFTTSEKGDRVAIISSTKVNSDGSKPQPQKPPYSVTDLLVDIVNESKNCTPNGSKTCYLRCEQTENYVSYNGSVYRIYGLDGNTVKFIYEGSEIERPYGQLGDCTSNTCCNGGRYLYNRLGQNTKVPKPTMDQVLDEFYTDKSVQGPKLQSQSTRYGSKKIALLAKNEYEEIAKSCPSNYLTGEASFWLIDEAESSAGAGAYNKGRNSSYAYDHAVDKDGTIVKKGAHKEVTFSGDYGTGNVITDELSVRPTIFLNNPTVSGGDGTLDNPYVLS